MLHGITGSGKTEVYIRAIQEIGLVRSPGDCAGARNQPYAAGRAAISGPLRPGRRAPQPYDRRRTGLALGADCARRGLGGRRRAQRGLCSRAAVGLDRRRRRARGLVQAGQCAALSRPRRGACAGPRPKTCRWCWARPRPRSKAGTERRQESIGWSKCRVAWRIGRCPHVRTIDLREAPDRSVAGGATQPSAAAGDARGAGRRRPGDSAPESPRLFDAPAMSRLRRSRPLSALRYFAHASLAARHCSVPLLRLRDQGAARLSAMQLAGHSLQGPGHREARGRGQGPLSRSHVAADGHRHDAVARQPRAGADRVSQVARCRSCWGRR